MTEIPVDVYQLLTSAGWRQQRRIGVEHWRVAMRALRFDMHPAAHAFLQEFGGLRVRTSGRGVTTARLPFIIDPTLCDGMEEWIRHFESARAEGLYPVGEAGAGGEGTLVITRPGQVLMLCEAGEGDLIVDLGSGLQAPVNLLIGSEVALWRP